jgi:CAAX prenyl protease-like protein
MTFRCRRAFLRKHRWITYVLPFSVFLLITGLEPTPDVPGGMFLGIGIPYSFYPLVYTLKIIATLAAIWFVLPGYRAFPLIVNPLAILVGLLGAVVWIATCCLELETRYLGPLLNSMRLDWVLPSGARSMFNPFEEFPSKAVWTWGFLAARFFGLVAVVPLIEEFFLRGFVMRFVMRARWWQVPFGEVSAGAILVGTLVPMATHPAELVAAGLWFSLVTWLMVKTRSIWDCVVAHAITNLLLGIYVVITGHWQLM